MSAILYYTFLIISLVGIAIWIDRYLETHRSVAKDPKLNIDSYTQHSDSLPFISVLIPALNEEKNIGTCLSSLMNQQYPHFEVIVINDRSTDNTRSIVEDFQKKYSNITLINNDQLHEGWSGKNYALNKGVAHAKGQWYLFTDADTYHHPQSLFQSTSYVIDKKVDMLTLIPYLEGISFWEKLLQPIAGAILLVSFPIKYSNNPKKKTAFANGQYILINKDVYHSFGGHEALKSCLLEDIAMAKIVKTSGYSLNVAVSPDVYKTRMYKNFKEIWNGWTRIFHIIYDKRISLIFLNALLLFVFSLLPLFLMLFCIIFFIITREIDIPILILLVVTIIEIIFIRLTTFRFYRLAKMNPYISLLNPLGCIIMLGVLMNAILKTFSKKGMTWRGTTYQKV
ncbi:MAG: glycosyltransferase [Candidatus Ancaeobacter aquaticus]|nr:glycosyltransferase [Candidatus Ancaeobacter aquaticus]